MNAGELRRLLASDKIKDSDLLVVEGSDHSYDVASVTVTTAMREESRGRRAHLAEDHGDLNPEGAGQRVAVLLVRRGGRP